MQRTPLLPSLARVVEWWTRELVDTATAGRLPAETEDYYTAGSGTGQVGGLVPGSRTPVCLYVRVYVCACVRAYVGACGRGRVVDGRGVTCDRDRYLPIVEMDTSGQVYVRVNSPGAAGYTTNRKPLETRLGSASKIILIFS